MPVTTRVSVTVDDAALRVPRQRLARGFQPQMRVIGKRLVRISRESVRKQRTPWGRAYPPPSHTTLELRRRGGLFGNRRPSRSKKALPRFGRSIRYTAGKSRVSVHHVGRRRAYAHVQQFGNPRNRLPNRAGGHPAPIPARQHLPLDRRGRVRLPRQERRFVTRTLAGAMQGARGGRR